jgi:hypothetical protein
MSALRRIGPAMHGGVHLVAGAVQEAGVDEGHAARRGGDAGRQVDAGAALLVHDAELHGVGRQPQQLLDAREQLAGERHLGRPVHLGLDDVDAALARVLDRALAVVQRDGDGDQGVEHALGNLAPAFEPHRRVAHQVADVAHEEQRAAMQGHLLALMKVIFLS